MKTDTKNLAAKLRQISLNILFGQSAFAAMDAANRLEELERELASERALADRLGNAFLYEWGPLADEALAAWKEARRE